MKNVFKTGVIVICTLFCINGKAQAATAVGNFNVAVSLQSQCQINTANPSGSATISDIAIAYTSFQTAESNGNTSFNVRCTNTLPFSLALDAGTGSASGITYLLSIGTAATTNILTAVTSLASQTGTGSNVAYFVSATAAAGQAGTSAVSTTPTAVNSARFVTITY